MTRVPQEFARQESLPALVSDTRYAAVCLEVSARDLRAAAVALERLVGQMAGEAVRAVQGLSDAAQLPDQPLERLSAILLASLDCLGAVELSRTVLRAGASSVQESLVLAGRATRDLARLVGGASPASEWPEAGHQWLRDIRGQIEHNAAVTRRLSAAHQECWNRRHQLQQLWTDPRGRTRGR
jgi:hypothetical protein